MCLFLVYYYIQVSSESRHSIFNLYFSRRYVRSNVGSIHPSVRPSLHPSIYLRLHNLCWTLATFHFLDLYIIRVRESINKYLCLKTRTHSMVLLGRESARRKASTYTQSNTNTG